MNTKKQKNAIFIADNRAFLLGHLLLQIKETNPDLFDEAIVYHQNMAEQDIKTLEKIMKCRFINYNTDKLPDELFEKNYNFKRFTKFMFARYEMFNYLDEFDNILWIDTDVLILGDLNELINKASKTGFAMLREDEINKSAENTDINRTNFINDIPNYDMNEYLYCSGIIVINKKLKNYNKITNYLYDKTIEYADNLNLPDQGILNLMIQDFKIDVVPIGDNGKYGVYPKVGKDLSNAVIIHSWGKNKFWNSWYLYKLFPEWKTYYDKWLKIGGSAYLKEIKPDISIIIPVYKPDLSLFKTQLDTILGQMLNDYEHYTNFEIIIVAEPFETQQLSRFIKTISDPRIELIINKNRAGIAKSINIGLKKALGKYIARIDDDDICAPTKLIKQFNYLEENPSVTLVTSDYEYFGDMNEKRISLSGEMSRAWSIFTCPFDHPTIMFRKDFFLNNNLLYDETRSHVEDWELWLRAFDKGMIVGSIPEILYYHRWYNGQAGQNNKTIEMMRELTKINFKKLNIDLTAQELCYVPPYQGKVDQEKYKNLQKIFNKALKNNRRKKLYDEKALERVFKYRLYEAKRGYIPEIMGINIQEKKPEEQLSLFKKILRKAYRPIRKRLYAVSAEAANDNAKYLYGRLENFINSSNSKIENKILEINNSIAITSNKIQTIENSNKKNKLDLSNQISDLSQKIVNINDNIHENSNVFLAQQEKISKLMAEQLNNTLMENLNAINNQIAEIKKQQQNLHDEFYDYNQKYKFMEEQMLTNLFFTKKIILFGTSEHGNIGDAAITVGTYEFIKKYYPDYKLIDISTYEFNDIFEKIKGIVNDNDLIFLQGGGNLGNKYIVEENVRRKVISSFPNNKIVILPQTIYFEDNEDGKRELEISQKIYNNHNSLTIFTRGAKSLELAQKYFPSAESHLMIDMALNIKKIPINTRQGILTCIRNVDDESGFNKEKYQKIFDIVNQIDPNYNQTTNVLDKNINKIYRNYEVNKQLENFSQHKLVVTDRLHGLIFALITKTPCIVLSSYNYKLNEFVEFLKDNKYVKFIDKNINDLEKEINNLLNEDIEYNIDYTEKFPEMIKIINKNDNNNTK